MAKRSCKGTNKAGKPCASRGVLDNGYCLAHQPEEVRKSKGFGGPQEGAGAPRKPRPHEVWRELVEANVLAWADPYLRAAGKTATLTPDGWKVEDREEGGAKLHGVAQGRGEIVVSEHDDLEAMMRATERILDRVYGRPKQQQEVTGPGGGPIQTSDVDPAKLTDEELATLRVIARRAAER